MSDNDFQPVGAPIVTVSWPGYIDTDIPVGFGDADRAALAAHACRDRIVAAVVLAPFLLAPMIIAVMELVHV